MCVDGPQRTIVAVNMFFSLLFFAEPQQRHFPGNNLPSHHLDDVGCSAPMKGMPWWRFMKMVGAILLRCCESATDRDIRSTWLRALHILFRYLFRYLSLYLSLSFSLFSAICIIQSECWLCWKYETSCILAAGLYFPVSVYRRCLVSPATMIPFHAFGLVRLLVWQCWRQRG